jgi:hypothetical protein
MTSTCLVVTGGRVSSYPLHGYCVSGGILLVTSFPWHGYCMSGGPVSSYTCMATACVYGPQLAKYPVTHCMATACLLATAVPVSSYPLYGYCVSRGHSWPSIQLSIAWLLHGYCVSRWPQLTQLPPIHCMATACVQGPQLAKYPAIHCMATA